MPGEHTLCLVCGGKELPALAGYEEHRLVRCGECGFVFIRKIPTAAELENFYREYGRETPLSPITVKRYHELLDHFEGYRQTGRILDVGCGVGHFLGIAKERGWDVYGNEVGEETLQKCVAKGIHMQAGALQEEHYPKNHFDVVTMFETIEHIHNPVEEVSRIRSFLRPGGLVYCTTPNFNSILRRWLKARYNVIHYPEHLSYYTPRTLDYLFERYGYEPIWTRTTGISVSRFQDSRRPAAESGGTGQDEKLRGKIEGNFLLKGGKGVANAVLGATGLGMTIKGYYRKKV